MACQPRPAPPHGLVAVRRPLRGVELPAATPRPPPAGMRGPPAVKGWRDPLRPPSAVKRWGETPRPPPCPRRGGAAGQELLADTRESHHRRELIIKSPADPLRAGSPQPPGPPSRCAVPCRQGATSLTEHRGGRGDGRQGRRWWGDNSGTPSKAEPPPPARGSCREEGVAPAGPAVSARRGAMQPPWKAP